MRSILGNLAIDPSKKAAIDAYIEKNYGTPKESFSRDRSWGRTDVANAERDFYSGMKHGQNAQLHRAMNGGGSEKQKAIEQSS